MEPYTEPDEFKISYPKTHWDGERFSNLCLKKRRIFDAHVHCLLDKESLSSPTFRITYGYSPPFNGSVEELIEMMDNCGVDKAVIFTGGCGGSLDEAKRINERISEIVADHPSLIGFGYAPATGLAKVRDVIREAVFNQNLKGLGEIFPATHAGDLAHIFEEANTLRIPVCIDSNEWSDGDCKWFAKNIKHFPYMKLIFSHMGQSNPQILELGKVYNNVFYDMSVEVHFNEARVLHQIKYLGAGKVLFATDFPAIGWTMHDDILRVERMPLSDSEKDRIFYRNFQDLCSGCATRIL